MSKDAALDSNGDFRDRSLAAAASATLHVAAIGWMFFVGGQPGWGKTEASGYSGHSGTSADFLIQGDFRQRIENKPILVNDESTAASSKPPESVPDPRPEHTIDPLDSPRSVDSDLPNQLAAAAIKESEVSATKPVETAITQRGTIAGGNGDDGLRAAYLAALRAAIRQHWSYQGPRQQCNLIIKQSPGGAVQSAVTGKCSIALRDRRALEAAALMAQPLPYNGFESVFTEEVGVEVEEE